MADGNPNLFKPPIAFRDPHQELSAVLKALDASVAHERPTGFRSEPMDTSNWATPSQVRRSGGSELEWEEA